MKILRKMQIIALFMITLVITMPVCFSANFLDITKASGKDNVWDNTIKKGYAGAKDYFKVEATAERDDGKEITPDMLGIEISGFNGRFSECRLITGKRYNCTYTSEERDWTGETFSIKAGICNDAECTSKTENKAATLIVDDTGPTVQITTQPKQTGINITLQYSVKDTAYSGAAGSECTGIDKIEFYDGNSLVFTSKAEVSGCSLDNQQADFFVGGSGDKKLTIKAYDKVGNAGQAKETSSFTLDHTEPKLVAKSFAILYEGQRINKISSSGMILSAEIKIESEDEMGKTINADFSALSSDPLLKNVLMGCSKTDKIYTCVISNLKIDKAGDASGVIIYAKDSWGNEMKASPESYPISVENTPPQIHGTDFALVKNGRILKGVPSQGDFADVYANFTDTYPGVDTGKMFADFKALNNDPNYAKTPVSSCQRHVVCTDVKDGVCLGEIKDDYYSCVWRNVFVKVEQSGTLNIEFDVSDSFGNNAKINQVWSIALDNTDPAIKHLGVGKEHVRDKKNWLKPSEDTKLTVVVEETGSGISEENMKFKYKENDVAGKVNCTETSGEWLCWIKQTTKSDTGTLKIAVSLKDDVGNSIEGTESLAVDAAKPVLNGKIKISSESPGFLKAGDQSLTIIINLTDESGFKNDDGQITAKADLSEIFTEDYTNTAATDCNLNGTSWICKWEISSEITSGARDAKIKFNLTDVAGNTLEHTETVSINDVEDSEPNFYTISIDTQHITPMEKFTVENIAGNYIQIIPFKLKNNGRCSFDAEIYDYEMAGDCSESLVTLQKNGNDYSGFAQFEINPGMNFDSTKADYPITNCRLKFIGRCGKMIYNVPERENFSISIPIVNEFKNPGDSIEQKVEQIKKDVDGGLWDAITWLDNMMGVIKNICTIKEMISSLFTLLDVVKFIGALLSKVAWLKPAGEAIFNGANAANKAIKGFWDSGIGKVVNTACGLVMCEAPSSGKTYGGIATSGGYCTYLKTAMEASGKGGELAKQYLVRSSTLDLCKRSWIFSLACLCLPGVTYNLNKIRQMECWKGVCYRDYTASGVMSMSDCDRQYSYDLCVYWNGQWAALGFIFEDLFKLLADVIENPVAYGSGIVWEIGKKAVAKTCDQGKAATVAEVSITLGCFVYDAMMIFETVQSAKQSAKSFTEMRWDGAQIDYCNVLFNPKTQGEAG